MRLKELREQNGISQREIAEVIGCRQNSLYRYEIGEREPSIEVIKKLASFFGVTVDYLVGHDAEAFEVSEYEKQLVLAARAADNRAKEDALLLLKTHLKTE